MVLICDSDGSYSRYAKSVPPEAEVKPVNETTLLALVFAVLLWLEWRYQLRSVRIAAALLALIIWLFAQPLPHRAARRVIAAQPAERVTRIADGPPLSEYASGVVTMEDAVVEDMKADDNVRLLSVGVLLWLACSPVFRRVRGPSVETRTDASAGDEIGS